MSPSGPVADTRSRPPLSSSRSHHAAGDSDRRFALADRDDVTAAQEEEQREEGGADERRASEVRDVEAVDERLSLVGRLRLATEPGQRVLRRVDRERCEDGEPERAADLLRRVEEARREPGVVGRGCRSSR